MRECNIASDSKFNICYNPEKSFGNYLYDDFTNESYLDFFGMYASSVLGHNHKAFSEKSYINGLINCSKIKVTNCEFKTKYSVLFDNNFTKFCNHNNYFTNFHYCCTGSLAVEAAIKTCLHYKNYDDLKVLSLKNSFHGANSFGVFVTDRKYPAAKKLSGLPSGYLLQSEANIKRIETLLDENNITCVLIEPIRCSAGDIYADKLFFKKLRELCTKNDVPLVFDEIQTGFCATGKVWYFEHLDIIPDIVIFGKKCQVSGMMTNKRLSRIFDKDNRTRLDVTFNGDVVDMHRCSQIIKVIKDKNLINNVRIQGAKIKSFLSELSNKTVVNVRGLGHIIAFDCTSTENRDNLITNLRKNNLLVNSTGIKSVRLRPSLTLTDGEVKDFFKKFSHALYQYKMENNLCH